MDMKVSRGKTSGNGNGNEYLTESGLPRPILHIATYQMETYYDGSQVAVCFTSAETLWSAIYFISSIMLFFLLPLIILVLLYAVIARQLLSRSPAFQRPSVIPIPSTITTDEISTTITAQQKCHSKNGQIRSSVHKYRKQVIFMLITVVSSFFICLLPFRAFTFWIIVMPPQTIMSLGIEGYYNVLYFCRIMLYLNSALNPILYNLMSSKFRKGFYQLIASCVGNDAKTGISYRHGRARHYQADKMPKVGNKRYSTMFDLAREGNIFTNSISTSTSSTQRTTYLRNSSITTSAVSGDRAFIETATGTAAAIVATITTAPVTGITITLPQLNESEKLGVGAKTKINDARKGLSSRVPAVTTGSLVAKTCAMSNLIHRTITEDALPNENCTNLEEIR